MYQSSFSFDHEHKTSSIIAEQGIDFKEFSGRLRYARSAETMENAKKEAGRSDNLSCWAGIIRSKPTP